MLPTCSLLLPERELPDLDNTRRLMWNGHFAITRLREGEYEDVRRRFDLSRDEAVVVDIQSGIFTIRVPERIRPEMESAGFFFEEKPPFRLIDPALPLRGAHPSPAHWLHGYIDVDLAHQTMRRFAADFPELATVVRIGESVERRPIFALRIADRSAGGSGKRRPRILFMGAHHGNEPLAVNFSLDLAYYLLYGCDAFAPESDCSSPLLSQRSSRGVISRRSAEIQDYLKRFELWFVPIVNPDGVSVFWEKNAWAGRKNNRDSTEPAGWNAQDGVDLNRNYPFRWNSGVPRASSGEPGNVFYRGPAPGSEPETQAIMRLAEEQRFSVALSYHCFATKVLAPYTIEGAINPVPNAAWRIGAEMASAGESYRPEKPYTVARNLYPVDGTDQDWLFNAYGTMAFIVEGAQLHPPFEPAGRQTVQGMRRISLRALELYLEGPTVSIEVVDNQNRPIEARIQTPDYYFFHNEGLRSSPRDGGFDFFMESPGSLTVRASRDGFAATEAELDCSGGVCDLRLQLTPLLAQ